MKTLTLDLSWINKLKLEDFTIRDTTWEAHHGSCQTYNQFTVRRTGWMHDKYASDFSGTTKPTLKQIKARLRMLAINEFVEENQFALSDQIEASIGKAEPSKVKISLDVAISP